MKIYSALITGKIARFLLVILLTAPFVTQAQSFGDKTDDVTPPVLPVKLLSFNATKIGNDVRLTWITASEYNNSHFNVLRSLNGVDFTNVGAVTGAGSATGTNNYQLVDNSVPESNLYYRLQQVDKDGKMTMSAVVFIKFNLKSNIELSMYPNPVINRNVRIGLRNAPVGNYTLSLINMSGQTVLSKIWNQTGSTDNHHLDLPLSITSGVYVLTLTDSKNMVQVKQKVVIE